MALEAAAGVIVMLHNSVAAALAILHRRDNINAVNYVCLQQPQKHHLALYSFGIART